MTVSDMTDDESAWLESKLAGSAEESFRSSERSYVAADLAERVMMQFICRRSTGVDAGGWRGRFD